MQPTLRDHFYIATYGELDFALNYSHPLLDLDIHILCHMSLSATSVVGF